jgi:hypothetical protein
MESPSSSDQEVEQGEYEGEQSMKRAREQLESDDDDELEKRQARRGRKHVRFHPL